MAKDVTNSSPPDNESIEDLINKDEDNLNPQCSVCQREFKTLGECLKHELLSHTLPKKTKPKAPVDNRLRAANKFINSTEKHEERANVHNALGKCGKGNELATVLKLLCMDIESLALIYKRIHMCLEMHILPLGEVKIYPFGSVASGLALRDSDIDIFVDATKIPINYFIPSPKNRRAKQSESPRDKQQKGSFNRINSILQRSPLFIDVYAIRQARVPIIKCKHWETGFSIDINVSRQSSVMNTQFISELVNSDVRVRELLLFLKLWAKNMQIIGKANLTSYCLITMVIFYLQQPWKAVGGKVGDITKVKAVQILKSVKELQNNCPPHFTEGVNYSFDLHSPENRLRIPRDTSTLDLLKGFFLYYKTFDFEKYIVSPFLGKAIDRQEFTEGNYAAYWNQLVNITQYMDGIPAPKFDVNRCMCVQDSFTLNHNVARSMLPPSKQYFMLCLENANTICQNLSNSTCGEILEKLLYDTVDIPATPPTNDDKVKTENSDLKNGSTNKPTTDLSFLIEPRKADLIHIANCLIPTPTDPIALLREWCNHYVKSIPQLLSAFYHIDLQSHPAIPLKLQCLEENNRNHIWHISASVDLWTNRFFQKSIHTTFWEYQIEQTKRLHELRRQDANFSTPFNAIFTICVHSDYTGITVGITLPDGSSPMKLHKKDPLRKFFNILKNTLINYNIKEALALAKHTSNDEMMTVEEIANNEMETKSNGQKEED